MKTYYKHGSYNVICDRCGLRFKAEDLRREWTNLMVCSRCFELRNPQDLLRVPKEDISPPWTRPEADDVFVSVPQAIQDESANWLLTETGILLQTEG